jgi:hypothetical protein
MLMLANGAAMSTATLAVTHYCERSADQFWAEPLNALTSLAFVLVAAAIAWRLRGSARQHWDVVVLAVLAALVGSGSFLWHTLATAWTEWADVIPIGLFISVFLLSFLLRIARWRWPGVILALVLFQLLTFAVQAGLPADFLNGSVFYLPAWVVLLLMGWYCSATRCRQTRYVTAMLGIFSLSLVARSVDAAVCPAFPLGTHFLWHLLNGLVLYLAMRLLAD